MQSSDDRRQIRFWQPGSPSITKMIRVEREDRPRTIFSEHFVVVAVYEGAFDGWYRGRVHTHTAGALVLKEPGEVLRHVQIAAPITLQSAVLSHEAVAEAAAQLGLRGVAHFKAPGFAVGERAARLAFELHAALVRGDAPELERATLLAETLGEILAVAPRASADRAPRTVRLARAYLHDEPARKITLDALADHAGLDKFHLVRAFRAAVGLPPYEYLTQVRVSKAKDLLQRGVSVASAAQSVGFYDESQLSRHFCRIVGVTPGRYARSFAGRSRGGQHRPSGPRGSVASSRHDRPSSH